MNHDCSKQDLLCLFSHQVGYKNVNNKGNKMDVFLLAGASLLGLMASFPICRPPTLGSFAFSPSVTIQSSRTITQECLPVQGLDGDFNVNPRFHLTNVDCNLE